MYLRKMKPRTTCLYSAASMLLRRASAAAQSFASKPSVAPFGGCVTRPVLVVPGFALAIRLNPRDVSISAARSRAREGAYSARRAVHGTGQRQAQQLAHRD